MSMSELPFHVERTIVIGAPPEIVFRFFTDKVRFSAWWGAGSEIDCRPGGKVHVSHPGGVVATGKVLEVDPPRRLVFTYGYEGEGKMIAPGASVVTVLLSDDPKGTRLDLRHDIPNQAARDEHVQGWRFQLALFANLVSREVQAQATERVDRFFEAWNESDGEKRHRALESCASSDVAFGDAYSCTSGIDDLDAHLAAARIHMPGVTLSRDGEVQTCLDTAIVRWIARKEDGTTLGRGTNVVDLGPDGRIRRVVGFWG
jgi:uncharacterized protein YndB with AHSA1/START domain